MEANTADEKGPLPAQWEGLQLLREPLLSVTWFRSPFSQLAATTQSSQGSGLSLSYQWEPTALLQSVRAVSSQVVARL